MEFKSFLETRAKDAQLLEAFQSSSLPAIKDSVTKLLELIGRQGIFDQYTRHDISHINKLLEMLDWLIPPGTKSQMTAADCLMTTLAVYFHDLGMLVTGEEFKHRNESKRFNDFSANAFSGLNGADYKDKIEKMSSDESERFLYQEYVRQHHAERIRAWIMGKSLKSLGSADGVVDEINILLSNLGERFRRDLALVCESHHLDDLNDLDKYKTSQPYGSSTAETANLQYCAILLRTADLLHVTKDRTPSVTFRLISPTDPRSIEEWHKQMAVISVRPKPGVDEDGNVDRSAATDTIEVHGFFTEPEGFFALTSYLNYAKKELRKSNEWAQLAAKKKGATHEFPWRDIDDSGLEARGFINRQFEFTLDQARILDLLTGHTLYNDTTVVIRELLQNSLDAIRLQWENELGYIKDGEIRVEWDNKTRTLLIQDNGTGMTQKVIDEHFLKVGSSLYQDDEFRKDHPNFSAISRFGIGVLSAFMVSDEIELTTCHADEPQARKLSLRSLHGKYLIRLLEKDSPEISRNIQPHGTEVRLRVRPSAELKDLAAILQRWILFPRCKVELTVDGGDQLTIGFLEPKHAIRAELINLGLLKEDNTPTDATETVKVEQRAKDGVTIAYAILWQEYFREWQFLPNYFFEKEERLPMVGTCVEGVRVDFSSPGYEGAPLLAIANASGPNAPKTNVARSGLEATAELQSLLKSVYQLYCEHVRAEIQDLQKTRSFSLTWALGEAMWLMAPLTEPRKHGNRYATPLDDDSLSEACSTVPSIPLEENGARRGVSPKELAEYPHFWTVDSALFASAEALIREIPAPVAISTLSLGVSADMLALPPGPYVSVQQLWRVMDQLAFRRREVAQIVIHRDKRRVDMRWTNVAPEPIWTPAFPKKRAIRKMLTQFLESLTERIRFNRDFSDVWIAQGEVQLEGIGSETAITSMGRTFVMPRTPYCTYLLDTLKSLESAPDPQRIATYLIALQALEATPPPSNARDFVRRMLSDFGRSQNLGYFDVAPDNNLVRTLETTNFAVFDPKAWERPNE